jgi:hypothetical protein
MIGTNLKNKPEPEKKVNVQSILNVGNLKQAPNPVYRPVKAPSEKYTVDGTPLKR